MEDVKKMQEEFMQIINNVGEEFGRSDVVSFVNGYLKESDFFEAPASTRFHGDYEYGLLEHSLGVYHRLRDKKHSSQSLMDALKGIGDDSIAVAALLHDVCKTNFYVKDVKNKKVDGVWTQVPYYTYDDKMPLGHGEKSVFILMSYMKLKPEEVYAIRWHMGPYVGQQDWNTLSSAFAKTPLLLALFEADMEDTYLGYK